MGKGSNNDKVFNDGYHIVHHENGKLHWTKMADQLGDNWQDYDKAGALLFKNCDFFMIGFFVMTGNLQKIARDYYVGTDENIIETMKHRLKPITTSKPTF